MEVLKQLSSPEQDEFNRIRVIQNGIDDRTLEQSLKYYLEYKKNTAGHVCSPSSRFLMRNFPSS